MENASKALIIAGAILLAILIIGLGMFVYTQASGVMDGIGMDSQAVSAYNAPFEEYAGTVSGAEAKALYDKGELLPYANRDLIGEIRGRQAAAVEDDYRIGQIEEYLYGKTKVCVLELWQKALQNQYSKPTPADSRAIGLIMANFTDWERTPSSVSTCEYGKQRCWVLKNATEDDFLI